MKKALHSLATLLCLLTLLLSASTCVQAEHLAPSQCNHCPKHAPVHHTLPSCCSAQQPSSAIASVEIKPPVSSPAAYVAPLPFDVISFSLSSHTNQLTGPPPLSPRITLRI
jgi:hypothetical protein